MNSQYKERPLRAVELLLVEDDPGDVLLTRKALSSGSIAIRLHVVGNGIDALRSLRNEGEYADTPQPDLILLDLNMPQMDGRETLAQIKADPALKSIPVIVLTTSFAGDDIERSYDQQANCFITKPACLDDFDQVVKLVRDFWLSTVQLPST